jgi:CxxC-x17-CxxC domain-containing protein
VYVDETLNCVDCGREFVFSSANSAFTRKKASKTNPIAIPIADRLARPCVPTIRGAGTATCSQCGGVAEVPFNPRGDKPVYCRDCFQARPSYS